MYKYYKFISVADFTPPKGYINNLPERNIVFVFPESYAKDNAFVCLIFKDGVYA